MRLELGGAQLEWICVYLVISGLPRILAGGRLYPDA